MHALQKLVRADVREQLQGVVYSVHLRVFVEVLRKKKLVIIYAS